MMDEPENTGPGIEPDATGSAGGIGGKPAYTVAAVDRALDLLDILTRTGPAGLARIAGEAGCTRTAAFRLLRTMAARGYVVQDGPRGNWRLGGRFSRLRGPDDPPPRAQPVPDVAGPVMERLARETGMVVYLLQRRDQEATVVSLCQTDPSQRRYGREGTTFPLHAGCGRLLLSFAPEAVQTLVLSGRLSRFSPATITDPRRLAADIPLIRDRGWFSSQDELQPGSFAFSAVIFDTAQAARLTDWILTISCPTIRLRHVDRRALTRAVIAAAEEVTKRLTGRPGG